MQLNQFDIINANLNPTKWSEQKGIRPCLIIQSNAWLNNSSTVLIAPFTSKTDKIYPFEFLVKKAKENWLKINSKIKCEQIKVIDKQRIMKKIGKLWKESINLFYKSIFIILDLNKDFSE